MVINLHLPVLVTMAFDVSTEHKQSGLLKKKRINVIFFSF